MVFQAGGRLFRHGPGHRAGLRGGGRRGDRSRRPRPAHRGRGQPHHLGGDLADRAARGVRGARRDIHGPRPARRGAQPDALVGRGRSIPRLVARRPVDRLVERQRGRVRADAAPGRRHRRARGRDHTRTRIPLPAVLGARQHQARLHRPHAAHPRLRPRDRGADRGRPGAAHAPRRAGRLRAELVARQPLDRLVPRARDHQRRRLPLRYRGRRAVPGDLRLLQRLPAGLRPRREAPLLLLEPDARPGLLRSRRHLGLPERHEHRRGDPARRRAVPLAPPQRRGARRGGRRGRPRRRGGRGRGRVWTRVGRGRRRRDGAARHRRRRLREPGRDAAGRGRELRPPAGGRRQGRLPPATARRRRRRPAQPHRRLGPRGTRGADHPARRRQLRDLGRRQEAARVERAIVGDRRRRAGADDGKPPRHQRADDDARPAGRSGDRVFDEVWRTYRDYFYDDDLHGLDWNGLRAQYGRPARPGGHALGRQLPHRRAHRRGQRVAHLRRRG